MEYLTIAIPKGRLFEPSRKLLVSVGLASEEVSQDTRRMVFELEEKGVRVVVMRAQDVPTYVERGTCDIGIVGKDILVEQRPQVYELLDLKFGFCRVVLAAPRGREQDPSGHRLTPVRVATKLPRIAGEYFASRGLHPELISLHGSVEVAPQVGLSDMIVDLVATGRTLAENDLVIVDEIMKSTARLVANRVSFQMKSSRIKSMLSVLEKALEEVDVR